MTLEIGGKASLIVTCNLEHFRRWSMEMMQIDGKTFFRRDGRAVTTECEVRSLFQPRQSPSRQGVLACPIVPMTEIKGARYGSSSTEKGTAVFGLFLSDRLKAGWRFEAAHDSSF